MSQKVAYVTGGMGGIGTSICQRLAKEGFKVIAGAVKNCTKVRSGDLRHTHFMRTGVDNLPLGKCPNFIKNPAPSERRQGLYVR